MDYLVIWIHRIIWEKPFPPKTTDRTVSTLWVPSRQVLIHKLSFGESQNMILTFASFLGNWIFHVSIVTALSRETTPALEKQKRECKISPASDQCSRRMDRAIKYQDINPVRSQVINPFQSENNITYHLAKSRKHWIDIKPLKSGGNDWQKTQLESLYASNGRWCRGEKTPTSSVPQQ